MILKKKKKKARRPSPWNDHQNLTTTHFGATQDSSKHVSYLTLLSFLGESPWYFFNYSSFMEKKKIPSFQFHDLKMGKMNLLANGKRSVLSLDNFQELSQAVEEMNYQKAYYGRFSPPPLCLLPPLCPSPLSTSPPSHCSYLLLCCFLLL